MLRILLFISIISVSITELLGQWEKEDVSSYLGWIQETKIGDVRNDGIMRVFAAESSMSEYTYTASGIDQEHLNNNLPRKITLNQNYPNPLNPKTIIGYYVGAPRESPSQVELSIYNLVGQKVVTLVSGKQKAGFHGVEWDASGFTSGVYLYRISIGSGARKFVQTKKMILLR